MNGLKSQKGGTTWTTHCFLSWVSHPNYWQLSSSHAIHVKWVRNILSRSFLFPECVSLACLKDGPFWLERALLEPERSLVLGPRPADCCGVGTIFPVCPVGMLLCNRTDNTTSTSGDGPVVSKEMDQSRRYYSHLLDDTTLKVLTKQSWSINDNSVNN